MPAGPKSIAESGGRVYDSIQQDLQWSSRTELLRLPTAAAQYPNS
jgi:hypothetical protein